MIRTVSLHRLLPTRLPAFLPALLALALLAPVNAQALLAQATPPATDGLTPPPVVEPRAVETKPEALPADPSDGFGQEFTMVPRPILQKEGSASWDEGYDRIVEALKAVGAELDRLKLKPAGNPLVIYTATDDAGFDYEVALPFEGATTEKPGDDFTFNASPAGKALRFTHRGAYDAMDPTYEEIANYLDAKNLDAQDIYVEDYRTDPRTTPQDNLVIDIIVPLK